MELFLTELTRHGIAWQEHCLLSEHSSFRIGGAARCAVFPRMPYELMIAVRLAQDAALPYFVVGAGCNTLFDDRGFDGVVIGISAGSMDCADIVYAQPEHPGETLAPNYNRFPVGLGLTRTNILPHYQMVKDNILDGRRLYEDITFTDSIGHAFLVLVDGSYVLEEEDRCEVYGESYLIFSGKMMKICDEGGMTPLYGG